MCVWGGGGKMFLTKSYVVVRSIICERNNIPKNNGPKTANDSCFFLAYFIRLRDEINADVLQACGVRGCMCLFVCALP